MIRRVPPKFWFQVPPSMLAQILAPLGAIYSSAVLTRAKHQRKCRHYPVLCVGNFTLGGSGKTPTVLSLLNMLRNQTPLVRTVVVTRGYGGTLQGPTLVNRSQHTYRDVGDEALLIAQHCPVIVAKQRKHGLAYAASLTPSMILTDDGMQNPTQRPDCTLAVFDAERGLGNRLVFPAGPLRASCQGQWDLTDVALIIGHGAKRISIEQEAEHHNVPCFHAIPQLHLPEHLIQRKLIAFSGIGNPDKFFIGLKRIAHHIVHTHAFPDHHAYSTALLEQLILDAKHHNAQLVTTEKDAVRIHPRYLQDIAPIRYSLRIDNADAFLTCVTSRPKLIHHRRCTNPSTPR